MTDEIESFSPTKISTWLWCRQGYHWIYDEDLAPKVKAEPPKIGDITHRLREKYLKGELSLQDIQNLPQKVNLIYPEDPEQVSERVASDAAELFMCWRQEYKRENIEIVSPELTLSKTFEIPWTGEPFILKARLDGMSRTPDGRLWRDELKTGARMDQLYIKGFKQGVQTGICHWLLDELSDEKVHGTIFNLVVNTKEKKATFDFYRRSQWQQDWIKRLVYGVVNEVYLAKSLSYYRYPSLSCAVYNRGCDYYPLCQNDTPARRQTLFISRSKEYEKEKGVDF